MEIEEKMELHFSITAFQKTRSRNLGRLTIGGLETGRWWYVSEQHLCSRDVVFFIAEMCLFAASGSSISHCSWQHSGKMWNTMGKALHSSRWPAKRPSLVRFVHVCLVGMLDWSAKDTWLLLPFSLLLQSGRQQCWCMSGGSKATHHLGHTQRNQMVADCQTCFQENEEFLNNIKNWHSPRHEQEQLYQL